MVKIDKNRVSQCRKSEENTSEIILVCPESSCKKFKFNKRILKFNLLRFNFPSKSTRTVRTIQ